MPVHAFPRRECQVIAGFGGQHLGRLGVGAGPAIGISQRRDLAVELGLEDSLRPGQLIALGIIVEPGQPVMAVRVRADRQARARVGKLPARGPRS